MGDFVSMYRAVDMKIEPQDHWAVGPPHSRQLLGVLRGGQLPDHGTVCLALCSRPAQADQESDSLPGTWSPGPCLSATPHCGQGLCRLLGALVAPPLIMWVGLPEEGLPEGAGRGTGQGAGLGWLHCAGCVTWHVTGRPWA